MCQHWFAASWRNRITVACCQALLQFLAIMKVFDGRWTWLCDTSQYVFIVSVWCSIIVVGTPNHKCCKSSFIASIDFGMGRTGSCAWCYPQCQDSCLPTVWVVAWPRWPLEIGDWNTGCHWLSLASVAKDCGLIPGLRGARLRCPLEVSAGRSGSTTLLEMLNQIPGYDIMGENQPLGNYRNDDDWWWTMMNYDELWCVMMIDSSWI